MPYLQVSPCTGRSNSKTTVNIESPYPAVTRSRRVKTRRQLRSHFTETLVSVTLLRSDFKYALGS